MREVDPERVPGLAAQRRELVEQAGLGADPVVLDARAELGELAPVGRLGLAGEREQREAERRLQRGRGGEPGAAREVALDLQAARRAARSRRRAARPRCRARTRASRSTRAGRREREGVVLAEVERAGLDPVAVESARGDGDAALDRERQREAAVVVGVLADQVDAAGAARRDPLTPSRARITRDRLGARRRSAGSGGRACAATAPSVPEPANGSRHRSPGRDEACTKRRTSALGLLRRVAGLLAARWGRRSCATSRRSAACRARAFSGVTRPGAMYGSRSTASASKK